MNINPRVEAAFRDFGVPIAFLEYTSKSDTYLTYYTWLQKHENFADDETLAETIECKVALETVNAVLYADDQIKEEITKFKSGTITVGIDDDNDKIFTELLEKTIDDESGFITSSVTDMPILVGFGHIVPEIVGGKRKYKVEFFYKVKFKPVMTDAKTKDDSLFVQSMEVGNA